MAENVEYTLTLRDMLSGKLNEANESAERLHGTMETIKGTLATLGVGFAIFEGASFIHEAVESFHQLEQNTAKVEANLESTGAKAGINMKMIEDWGKKLRETTGISTAEIRDMQSQMLTFPSITKDTFEQSMGQVADIAKQTNHGLTETAIMYGKALSNPEEGLQKLQRYGVILTAQEKARIVQVQHTNGLVAAQKEMMELIKTSGYEGVAAKMFDADPLGKYKLMMGSVKGAVGELAMETLIVLKPALEWFAGSLKDGVQHLKDLSHWMKDNKETVKDVAIGVGLLFGAWALYNVGVQASILYSATMNILLWAQDVAALAAATGTSFLSIAMWDLNIAMDANPIGLVVVAAGALAAAFYWLHKQTDNLTVAVAAFGLLLGPVGWFVTAIAFASTKVRVFKQGIYALAHGFLAFVHIVQGSAQGLGTIIGGIFHMDRSKISAGLAEMADATKNGFLKVAMAASEGWDEGGKKFDQAALKAGASAKTGEKPKTGAGATLPTTDETSAKKATGTKSIVVNISINKLIETFKINTTNLTEGTGKVREIVANTILSAVNDSSITADI